MKWLLLVSSLPTGKTATRMRTWRALKTTGAAVLRDGVYLLPERDSCSAALQQVADDLRGDGGNAFLFVVSPNEGPELPALFDRSADYAELLTELTQQRAGLTADSALTVLRQLRRLRRNCEGIAAIDFFPGPAQQQARTALAHIEQQANRLLAPDEPQPEQSLIPPRAVDDHQGRRWATRRRPWVDRLACAWLIRRFIDPTAEILWLETPTTCPADALGFDFDGATFSHVETRVSFEVMLQSFALTNPALTRIGALVHYLDVGGVQPPEAGGVERVLAGLRASITNDDQLLASACAIFDGLLAAFTSEKPT